MAAFAVWHLSDFITGNGLVSRKYLSGSAMSFTLQWTIYSVVGSVTTFHHWHTGQHIKVQWSLVLASDTEGNTPTAWQLPDTQPSSGSKMICAAQVPYLRMTSTLSSGIFETMQLSTSALLSPDLPSDTVDSHATVQCGCPPARCALFMFKLVAEIVTGFIHYASLSACLYLTLGWQEDRGSFNFLGMFFGWIFRGYRLAFDKGDGRDELDLINFIPTRS